MYTLDPFVLQTDEDAKLARSMHEMEEEQQSKVADGNMITQLAGADLPGAELLKERRTKV